MTRDIRQDAIALYDRFTHESMDRRLFMAALTRLAGSAAAASALLAGIAASPAAAAIVPADDPRIKARRTEWTAAGGRRMKGYLAEPRKAARTLGSVLVIHENRGLNAHIEDVARRLALANYRALAADFLSPVGGTPADENAAREAIGKLDIDQSVADAVATLAHLKSLPRANKRVAAIGFCWGGAMVNRVAVAAGTGLDAGIAYYGSAPDPSLAAKVQAAMLLHFAGLDERVNKTGLPWADALKAAGKKVDSLVYPGVNHAFHNDTSAERYDRAAAERSWQTSLAFLARTLAT